MRIKQKKRLLNFLQGYISSNGEAPLIREICNYFGYTSTGSVHQQLTALEAEGLIRRTRQWRGIEIVK